MGTRRARVIVVDCSYTMALALPDEARPATVDDVLSGRMFAPAIWTYEVANALRNVVRRRRLDVAQVPAACARIEAYGVEIVSGSDGSVHHRYRAAHDHDLAACDAAYLELALARRCALATLDARLAAAGQRVGLTILD